MKLRHLPASALYPGQKIKFVWGTYTEVHMVLGRSDSHVSFNSLDDPLKVWRTFDVAVNDNDVELLP